MAAPDERDPVLPARPDDARLDRDARQRRIGYQMFGIGWTSASEAIAGLLVGWFVDWKFATGPWGLIAGGAAGVVVGMWSLVRRAISLQRTNAPEGRAGKPPRNPEGDSNG